MKQKDLDNQITGLRLGAILIRAIANRLVEELPSETKRDVCRRITSAANIVDKAANELDAPWD